MRHDQNSSDQKQSANHPGGERQQNEIVPRDPFGGPIGLGHPSGQVPAEQENPEDDQDGGDADEDQRRALGQAQKPASAEQDQP